MSTNRPPSKRTRSSRHAADKLHAYEQMMQQQYLSGQTISHRSVMPSARGVSRAERVPTLKLLISLRDGIRWLLGGLEVRISRLVTRFRRGR